MIEIIQQNPIISLIVILVPVIGGLWKVMEILFLKPRDFRISVLEKQIDEIRKEIQKAPSRTEHIGTKSTMDECLSSPAELKSDHPTEVSIEKAAEKTTLLNDMDLFYETWWDRDLTELQRSQFEKSYLGQKIIWKARLSSVTEEKDGYFWVSLKSKDENNFGIHVIAVFDSEYKNALSLINKGQVITVSGELDSFSLSPLIKKCSIIKT